MTVTHLAGDLLTASVTDRLLTYRLLPYGEPGRTSAGTVTASRGVVSVPDDVRTLVANLEHDPTRPVARFVSVDDSDDQLTATLRVLDTTAGNDLLVEAAEGVRTGISVELAGSVVRGGQLRAGVLTGAGFTTRPAYPSASLVAADTPQDTDPAWTDDTAPDQITVNGITYTRTPPDDQDDTTTTEDDVTTTTTTPPVVTASAPPDLTARAPARVGVSTTDVARLFATFHATRDPDVLRMLQSREVSGGPLFAALTDITYDGTGGVSQDVARPQWIDELWTGRAYQRRYVPLFGHADLTSLKIVGWRWVTKPTMAPWAGNKTAVPSGPVDTEPAETTAKRLAGAHDIAREYRDFNVEGFWDGYFRAMTESYAKLSDGGVITDVTTAATDVVPGTVPAGVPTALAYIVDGALAFIDNASASFAIVAKDLWRSLVLTPTDSALEFLSASLGLEEGSAAGFKILPGDDTFPAGSVLVGAREAATVYELPGSPLRVEAENIANGGIDEGMFGYYGTVVHDADALSLVAPTIPLAAGTKARG